MLLLVLMLQVVTPQPVVISHVRLTKRHATARRIPARMHLMPDCRLDQNCGVSPNSGDRLMPENTTLVDPKQVALRGPANCGTTGMPVCPSRGTPIVRANLDN